MELNPKAIKIEMNKSNENTVWFAIIVLTMFIVISLLSNVRLVKEIEVIQSNLDDLAEKPSCWLLENGKHIGVGKIDGSCEAWERVAEINNKFIGATGVSQRKDVDIYYVTVQESDIPKEYRDSLKGK